MGVERARPEHPHAALVEQPVEQPFGRDRPDRSVRRPRPCRSACGPPPRRRPRRPTSVFDALRHVARDRDRAARARSGASGRNCSQDAAGPPAMAGAVGPGRDLFADREAHPRRDLLGAQEIFVRGVLPGPALERHHALVAARVRRPGRWSWRDGHGRAAGLDRRWPAAIAAATCSLSKRAQARTLPGVRKSTTSMRTGPSVWVCRMNRPSNFSAEPSSTVSTIASPRSLATGAG